MAIVYFSSAFNTVVPSKLSESKWCLFFFRTLRRSNLSATIQGRCYHCAIKSINANRITVWYTNCFVADSKALQRVVKITQHITRTSLPAIKDFQKKLCLQQMLSVLSDSYHSSYLLFQLLPSKRPYRSLRTRTSRFMNNLFSTAVSLLNSAHELPLTSYCACSTPVHTFLALSIYVSCTLHT